MSAATVHSPVNQTSPYTRMFTKNTRRTKNYMTQLKSGSRSRVSTTRDAPPQSCHTLLIRRNPKVHHRPGRTRIACAMAARPRDRADKPPLIRQAVRSRLFNDEYCRRACDHFWPHARRRSAPGQLALVRAAACARDKDEGTYAWGGIRPVPNLSALSRRWAIY